MGYSIHDVEMNEYIFQYLKQLLYSPEKAALDRRKLPVSAKNLADALELLHRFILEERNFAQDLLQGRIHAARIPARDNVLAGPLKAVHSMLQHLIWLMKESIWKQNISAMFCWQTSHTGVR